MYAMRRGPLLDDQHNAYLWTIDLQRDRRKQYGLQWHRQVLADDGERALKLRAARLRWWHKNRGAQSKQLGQSQVEQLGQSAKCAGGPRQGEHCGQD